MSSNCHFTLNFHYYEQPLRNYCYILTVESLRHDKKADYYADLLIECLVTFLHGVSIAGYASPVLATIGMSVCPFRPSVTRWHWVKTTQVTSEDHEIFTDG